MGSVFEWIPRFALRRPVTMVMALAAVVVLGAVSYFRLPLELMPSGSTVARIWLQTYYRNAPAGDILEHIIEPAEERLRTLPRLKSIESKASFEQGSINLEFHRDADLTQAYLEVREILERLRPDLPEDFDRFRVLRWDSHSRPVLWARVVPPAGTPEDQEAALDRLEQVLTRIAGVAKVDLWGRGGQELAVLLEPNLLQSLGVEPLRVVQALGNDNFSLPLGWLEAERRRTLVRATANLATLQQVRDLPVAPPAATTATPAGRPAGEGLRIGDLGKVEVREKERTSWSKVEGRPAVAMAVYKETGANTVSVGRAIRATLAGAGQAEPLLAGLEVHPLFEEDQLISGALDNLEQTALWGALLAFGVLFLFFRRIVPALLVMAAVPVSVLFTLVGLFFLGGSINIISLIGLMLALGMLVDNAVVVVENTTRLRAEGLPALEAAQKGAGEVGLAILLGTLTTAIVFLPLPFLGAGAFLTFVFRQLSYPIVLALFGSLLVAALFVPLVARLLLRGALPREPRWFGPLREAYGRWLRLMVARRLDATLLLLLVLASVAIPLAGIKWDLFGSRAVGRMWISFQHSPVFSLEETEAYFDRLMTRLDPKREALGIRVAMVRYQRGGGTLSLFLKDEEGGPKQSEQLFAGLREVIGEEPGVTYSLRGAEGENRERVLTVRLFGPDPDRLRDLAGQVRSLTQGVPGLGDLVLDEERPPREIAVRIDRRRAETQGLTARAVAQRVAGALRGTSALPGFRLGEGEIEVVVAQALPPEGVAALEALTLPGRGGTVPLGAVAQMEFRPAPEEFTRTDGRLSLALEGRFEGDDFEATQRALNQRMARLVFPRGYSWGRGEQARSLGEDQASLGTVLPLSFGAIFLVMGILFESFLLPLTVLATIPLAFLGSAWAVFLTGTAMDTTGMVGLVILVGVVVNNGIVLVDRINRNRWEGVALDEAVVRAGEVRLRPILMTALTTIGGLMPMVFGMTNVAGYSFVAMGRVVAGGLLAGTLLTLFVVPLAYHLLARTEIFLLGNRPPPALDPGHIATPP